MPNVQRIKKSLKEWLLVNICKYTHWSVDLNDQVWQHIKPYHEETGISLSLTDPSD